MNYAIVLSAGFGSRMKSDLPKGAVVLNGEPMCNYSIRELKKSNFEKIIVVLGYKREIIKEILKDEPVEFAYQEELNGTAMAVMAAKESLDQKKGCTLIVPVDMPLIKAETYMEAINAHKKSKNDLTVLTSILDNPFGYGRIVKDEKGNFISIKEELDATDSERKIKEVNSGVMVVSNELLFNELSKIEPNNKKKEYYLTDIVSIMKNDGYKVGTYSAKNPDEIQGINDMDHLFIAEKILKKRI